MYFDRCFGFATFGAPYPSRELNRFLRWRYGNYAVKAIWLPENREVISVKINYIRLDVAAADKKFGVVHDDGRC